MDENSFDTFAKNYTDILSRQLGFFEEDNLYFAEYKIAKLKNLIQFSPKNILDFGCGIGRSTSFLTQHFPEAHIYGCDVSEQSLIEAKKSLHSADFFLTADLLIKQNTFDLIFVSNVFHHIRPGERLNTLNMLTKSATAGGSIVIFEHNPYNPVTRHLVKICPFDHDAILLKPKELKLLFKDAGIQNIHLEYTLFFPSFLKRLRFLEKYLSFIPLGGQYVMSGSL